MQVPSVCLFPSHSMRRLRDHLNQSIKFMRGMQRHSVLIQHPAHLLDAFSLVGLKASKHIKRDWLWLVLQVIAFDRKLAGALDIARVRGFKRNRLDHIQLTILKSKWEDQHALKKRRLDLYIALHLVRQSVLVEKIAKGLRKTFGPLLRLTRRPPPPAYQQIEQPREIDLRIEDLDRSRFGQQQLIRSRVDEMPELFKRFDPRGFGQHTLFKGCLECVEPIQVQVNVLFGTEKPSRAVVA